ncbi:hypothetical protein LSH36_476g02045 [Paralvinella palmiformis]|uniref:Uncharacterized protein n=1 Tax=Paralvinella palmiformis TaxID=53620 RepID=A0AAD9MYZ9_9ANNE|nr:hypothetical protein LSH36_476g02045 [Paralvinella palmiformis]
MWSADDGVNDADDGADETKIFYPGAIPRITDLVYPSVRRDLLLVRPGMKLGKQTNGQAVGSGYLGAYGTSFNAAQSAQYYGTGFSNSTSSGSGFSSQQQRPPDRYLDYRDITSCTLAVLTKKPVIRIIDSGAVASPCPIVKHRLQFGDIRPRYCRRDVCKYAGPIEINHSNRRLFAQLPSPNMQNASAPSRSGSESLIVDGDVAASGEKSTESGPRTSGDP